MLKISTTNKNQAGFTLADMMVATAIIVTISVVLVVNFRSGRQRDELRNAGLLMVSLINQAQAYSLAGRTVVVSGSTVYPVGGWGVSFNALGDRAYLFADDGDGVFSDGSELWQETFILSDYKVVLDENLSCVNLGSGCQAANKVDYIFVPPLGARKILNNPVNQGNFEIVIKHQDDATKLIRLASNAVTGQVTLGSIENMP